MGSQAGFVPKEKEGEDVFTQINVSKTGMPYVPLHNKELALVAQEAGFSESLIEKISEELRVRELRESERELVETLLDAIKNEDLLTEQEAIERTTDILISALAEN